MDVINLDMLQRRLEAMQQTLRDQRVLDMQRKGWAAFGPLFGGARIREKEQQMNKLLERYNSSLKDLSLPADAQFDYEENPMYHDAAGD